MLFDAGYATFSVIVPLEAWVVPLREEGTPPGLQQADLSSKRRIKLAKALNLMKANSDLLNLPFSKDTPQPLRDVS